MGFKNLYKFTKNLRLLYVEDDKALRDKTVALLKDFFHTMSVAENGQEGFEKYCQSYKESGRYFDIVITDIHKPLANGTDMAEAIMQENPLQSIFIISAYNDSRHLTKLINIGIDKFLTKPLQTEQLLHALQKKAEAIHNEQLASDYYNKLAHLAKHLESEVKKRTAQLNEQIFKDNLTKLYNRYALSEDLKTNKFAMLALVDIDRLQFINDLYGAEIGNQIIIKVANILSKFAIKHGCKLYRTSGDEFALTHPDISLEQSFAFIAQLSAETTNLQLFLSEINQEINVDTTIGVALKDDNLLTHADIALKHAKQNHNQYVIYNSSLNSLNKMQDIIEWKNKIELAIANNNIVPVFQPIVDKNGNILKYETLMRLREIDNGDTKLISPYFFLDTAIKTKLYPQLSYIIVQKTINKLKQSDVTLSVNLTYNDFINPDIIALLADSLEHDDIGNRLIFEIVESENIKDYQILQNFIDKFRKYGVRIAIDDFGAGFSSFQHIIQTAPDYIKIDGSLIKDINTDLSSLTVVKAIIQFSKELGIKVIAEFVHAEHILDILSALGIKEYQGFYFYEPKPYLIEEKELETV